ncbi:cation:proton antiporter [Natranaerobius thermophilus]|uniref:Sodium/hydrogen exchanger n=1 Tax=Natranaerobius thermophilus (strain ATCC BAA-1301 / DSM 18059 / JW/NM-WN-LF) TaxID=457570 RepID=B2A4V2_NATTJ|nr:cation:proton antiporter [Natranaerobius thermophilus]ACB83874.1 sodium/hydrogen exchanger [Natranaerobius thermophilus JW/NM-WN-LF]
MTIYDQSLGIAVILLLGFCGGKLVQRFKVPMVVGYIIIGLILSPSLLNVIPSELNESLNIIRILGLGIIALFIGSELEISKLKQLGKAIVGITVVQIFGAFFVVFFAMFYLLNLSLEVSLLLGAMATATAPASPLAVVRETKAKGPFTSTLLGVVAVDDALCIIFFGIISAIVGGLIAGNGFTVASILEPIIELGGSTLLGAVLGCFLCLLLKATGNRQHKVLLLVGIALLNSGMANLLNLSPLLANMVSGFVVANLYSKPKEITYLEDIELPIYIGFFVLAGAELHLDILLENWVFAAVYIVARSIGKVGGAFLGARWSQAPILVQKYLGFAMFSKAGVTIGLLMIVQSQFPDIAPIITAIELAAITVFELFGPLGTKYALVSSGEANIQYDFSPSTKEV